MDGRSRQAGFAEVLFCCDRAVMMVLLLALRRQVELQIPLPHATYGFALYPPISFMCETPYTSRDKKRTQCENLGLSLKLY